MRAFFVIAIIMAATIGMVVANEPEPVAAVSAIAPVVCNDAEIQSLSAAIAALKSSNDAHATSLAGVPASLAKLSAALESQSAKLSTPATPAAAAAPVDLAPIIAAISGVQAKVQAFATADDESDRSESAALTAVATDITALKSSVAAITTQLKDSSKSQGVSSTRFETLEKEVSSLKALLQQLIDASSTKGKKDDTNHINTVLENQAEILKLYRQANEPFDWKATLGNATQTATKYSRYAFDFGVAKGTVAWNTLVEYVKFVQANPPDVKVWKAEALKVQGEVASFVGSKGVPKDKTTLVANILLGVGAVILLLITLTIVIKFIKCICCCGRKKKTAIPSAPLRDEELKEEADIPAAPASGASKRKGKKAAE